MHERITYRDNQEPRVDSGKTSTNGITLFKSSSTILINTVNVISQINTNFVGNMEFQNSYIEYCPRKHVSQYPTGFGSLQPFFKYILIDFINLMMMMIHYA